MYVSVQRVPADDGYGTDDEAAAGAGDLGADEAGAGRDLEWLAPRARLRALRELLGRPLAPYYLIVGITALLLLLGLVMVLSTGSVFDLIYGESPYSDFGKQLAGVLVGLPLTWIAARTSPRLYRAAAYPLLAVAVIGLGLTLIHGVGMSQNGGTRWIQIGPVPFEPSEIAKLALVLWGADLLARKERLGLLADWRHMLVPLMPGAGLLAMLVMAGDDLGTTFILLIIFLTLLWIIGTPGRVFVLLLILMALVLLLLAVTSQYRWERLTSFLSPGTNSLTGNYQSQQGLEALGSGGVFGVGLGASGAKWGYVPEPTTDYIFAIIGEELGLVGTLLVTALYGGLAYAGMRVARRAQDTFDRLAAAAITSWVVTQAAVNIGVVIGVLPTTGVPLPLVSAGLTSLLVTMVALGMLMSFARRDPDAAQVLAARGHGGPLRALGAPLRRFARRE